MKKLFIFLSLSLCRCPQSPDTAVDSASGHDLDGAGGSTEGVTTEGAGPDPLNMLYTLPINTPKE